MFRAAYFSMVHPAFGSKELTPEAGHAEVFGEAQRVEWMLTQRRSLQEPAPRRGSRGVGVLMDLHGFICSIISIAYIYIFIHSIVYFRHLQYQLVLYLIILSKLSKLFNGAEEQECIDSLGRTCNSWHWTWKKVARSLGIWDLAETQVDDQDQVAVFLSVYFPRISLKNDS